MSLRLDCDFSSALSRCDVFWYLASNAVTLEPLLAVTLLHGLLSRAFGLLFRAFFKSVFGAKRDELSSGLVLVNDGFMSDDNDTFVLSLVANGDGLVSRCLLLAVKTPPAGDVPCPLGD